MVAIRAVGVKVTLTGGKLGGGGGGNGNFYTRGESMNNDRWTSNQTTKACML